MKKLGYLVLFILLIVIACERHELTPIPNEHVVLIDTTIEVNAIVVDNLNTVWVGTDKGLFIISDEKLVSIDSITFGNIRTLLYEESGNLLWIGTETGLYKATVSNVNLIDEHQIPGMDLSADQIRCAYADSTIRRWFGTELGMTMNEEDTWKNDSFRVNILNRIFKMQTENIPINSIVNWKGDVFFATEGSSMWRAFDFNDTLDAFSGATQWVSPYNGRNMTPTLNVVFVDSKNQLWMGGQNGIQVHWGDDPADITSYIYYNSELSDSIVQVITESSNGNIWVGMENGLNYSDGTFWTDRTSDLPYTNVKAIAFDKMDGSVYIGTKNGLIKLLD